MKDIRLLLSSPTTCKVASIFSRKVHARHREGHLGKANGHDQNAREGYSRNGDSEESIGIHGNLRIGNLLVLTICFRF